MKHLQLAIGYAVCLAFFAAPGCRLKAKSQIVGEPSPDQPPSSPIIPSPTQQPSSSPSPSQPLEIKAEKAQSLDLPKLASSVQPAVILVTVFDSSGKLVRTQTGFFISSDGRFVTTAEAIGDGINAVAKTADGGIYNVSGILAASATLNLAILQADVQRARFLTVNKNANLQVGTPVGVVGSGLAGSAGAPRQATISTLEPDHLEIAAAISSNSVGSPVIDTNGQLIGVIVSAGEKVPLGLRARWIRCYRKLRPMPKLSGHRPHKPLPARAQRQSRGWFMRPRQLFLQKSLGRASRARVVFV
jgi:S1-C subfamily serine protease